VSFTNALHLFSSDDKQVPNGAESQHFFVERRGTGSGLAPHRFHAERIRNSRKGGENSCPDAGNRLICKGQAGADREDVESEIVTPGAAAIREGEKFVSLGPCGGRD